nr:MAG TPA: hypothetical protein [Caudoviricetes sp.]
MAFLYFKPYSAFYTNSSVVSINTLLFRSEDSRYVAHHFRNV